MEETRVDKGRREVKEGRGVEVMGYIIYMHETVKSKFC